MHHQFPNPASPLASVPTVQPIKANMHFTPYVELLLPLLLISIHLHDATKFPLSDPLPGCFSTPLKSDSERLMKLMQSSYSFSKIVSGYAQAYNALHLIAKIDRKWSKASHRAIPLVEEFYAARMHTSTHLGKCKPI